MGAKGVEAGIPLAAGMRDKVRRCLAGQGGWGKGGGKGEAYIRFMGAKGVEAGIPLAVGMGSSTLHSSHEVSQALQPRCCCIICHMQPCLHSHLAFSADGKS